MFDVIIDNDDQVHDVVASLKAHVWSCRCNINSLKILPENGTQKLIKNTCGMKTLEFLLCFFYSRHFIMRNFDQPVEPGVKHCAVKHVVTPWSQILYRLKLSQHRQRLSFFQNGIFHKKKRCNKKCLSTVCKNAIAG